MKILYRGKFIAAFKRTYIQDEARPIIVTSPLSYETSPYFSWREKSLLSKFLSQLEPCGKSRFSHDVAHMLWILTGIAFVTETRVTTTCSMEKYGKLALNYHQISFSGKIN